MATIKINYGGTTYSMVKTPTKITTPSVKVDGGYIPCFKGDRFSEVLNGSMYYTLSPIKVGEYRMACGSRAGFNGNVILRINYSIEIYTTVTTGGSYQLKTSISIKYDSHSVSTTQTGYTAVISNFSFYPNNKSDGHTHSGGTIAKITLSSTCSGNVTVKDSSGTVVKTFSFSIPVSKSYSKDVSGTGYKQDTSSSTLTIG